jgi:hypothetical protein
MKTTNHTPGTWEIETCNENGPFLDSFYIQTDSKHWDGNDIKRIICRFPTGTGQFGEMGRENLANAHLIAAAPKLLQVLKDLLPEFVDLYERFDPTGEIAVWDQWTQEALEVIAEAEGAK